MINERDQVDSSNENEKRIALNHINAKLQLLNNRIATARIVNLNEQTPGHKLRLRAKPIF